MINIENILDTWLRPPTARKIQVENDVMKALDTNGDGKLDEKDAGVWLQKVLDVLANDELEGIE